MSRIEGLLHKLFPPSLQSKQIGGTRIPMDIMGLEQNLNGKWTFTQEKRREIQNKIRQLITYYQNNPPINVKPLQVYPDSNPWKIPYVVYRGIIIADLFVAAFVTDGKIVNGTQISHSEHALPSEVNVTYNHDRALRFAKDKAHLPDIKSSYRDVFQLTDEQLEILDHIGFFEPAVIEFEIPTDRRLERGTRPYYKTIIPYLKTTDITQRCLDKLKDALGYDLLPQN